MRVKIHWGAYTVWLFVCPGWNPPVLLYVVLMIPHVHFDPFCACKCGKAIPTSKLSLMVTLPTITTKYGLEWPSKTKQGLNHNQGIKATLWPALSPPTAGVKGFKKGGQKGPAFCILKQPSVQLVCPAPRTLSLCGHLPRYGCGNPQYSWKRWSYWYWYNYCSILKTLNSALIESCVGTVFQMIGIVDATRKWSTRPSHATLVSLLPSLLLHGK